MTPAPGRKHQRITGRLYKLLDDFVEQNQLGEVANAPRDVYLAPRETYQPDILFISQNRIDISAEDKVNGAPDLVVEVLSPSTGYYDLKPKYRAYEKYGVQEYWIVDPEEKKQRNLPPPESNLHLSRQEVLGRRSRLAHIAGVYSVLSRPASGVENNKSPLGRGGALATGWVMLIKYTTNSYSKHDVYTTETHESVGVGIFKKLFPIPKKHLSSPHTRQVPVPLSASFL